MPDHGKLLVVELVLPPGEEPFFGKWLDLHMLVMAGGRERTAAEYDALFRAAGFALARVVPTPPGPSVVEAVPGLITTSADHHAGYALFLRQSQPTPYRPPERHLARWRTRHSRRSPPPIPGVPSACAGSRWRSYSAGPSWRVFDNFVVNVAIPTMQRDLHASFAQIQFVVAGYALAYAVTLVTGGRLGDIYGRKRLFLLGLAGFTLTSALCGLAPGPGLLVGARIAQGLRRRADEPQVLSIIQVTFAAQERSRAFGIFGALAGIASLAGQVLGGLLIRANILGLSWRPVFLINVPIGIGVLIAARFLLAESALGDRAPARPRRGGVLTAGLFLLTFPLVEGRDAGWPSGPGCASSSRCRFSSASWPSSARATAQGGAPLVVLRLFHRGRSSPGCWSPSSSTPQAPRSSSPSPSTSNSACASPR